MAELPLPARALLLAVILPVSVTAFVLLALATGLAHPRRAAGDIWGGIVDVGRQIQGAARSLGRLRAP